MAPGVTVVKPAALRLRRGWRRFRCAPALEEQMRAVGKVLLTGAAALVAWKIFAALFVGLLGMAFKVALVVMVVYFLLRMFNGNHKKEE